ncbi:MFS transporter [Salmonella enterica]|nr:MFS transporter [Salmonella enterica]EBR3855360.1 MFS transporter [Salmonella enterica subsp. enterica]ECH9402165.1 MFS transporter [Salmonella enterica subsp. diarizonae]ECT9714876.1 MFS transporter [Salmonella enterica subsp. diarizonae str. CFSAN000553]EDD5837488.1 MFS transporter [Salmonella enterica subsp. enterica serovar Enteritidis]EGE4751148.1 MFS transporter [Salmonella enterica subsp. diarizonae serovar 38:[k]:z35]ESJ22678.1 major facilitator transporter [Salmonella enterica sub
MTKITTSPLSAQSHGAVLKEDNKGHKAIAAASIGNALEWYDFSVYAFFAVYIAQNFFHQTDAGAQLFEAFLAFGLGFVIRPLGALVIGAYGDRAGRKAALTLTIMTMAVGTAIIAFAPPYSAIGIGAPLLILCGRVLQGFSAGGEVGGAAAFLVEHAPANKKGQYASWLQASMGISNILGALVATAVTLTLSHEQVGDWGWRIPFIIGLSIAPVGLWMRKTLAETPLFIEEQTRRKTEKIKPMMPLFQLFKTHRSGVLLGTGLSILWAVSVYSLIIFMPIYVQRVLHFESHQAFLAALIGNCFMVVCCVAAGSYSDRIGTHKLLMVGAGLLLVCSYPLLMLLNASHTTGTLIFVQSLFCILVSLFVGVAPVALSELFPTEVRASGMSVSYNLAVTIFGGFAPAILTWLTENTGTRFAPAWYVMIASVLAMVTLIMISRQKARKTF